MDQQPAAPAATTVPEHGINMDMLIKEWETSKQYTDGYTQDFKNLDNIVDGIPVVKEDGAPYVGDTTIAGLVRQIPRESIQQLPVFAARVNGSKVSVNAIVASWILRNAVFNEDTFGRGLLSTLQMGGEQALTHGFAPFMCATGSMFNEFGTTLKLMHYSDIAPEPGIQDSSEAGFHYAVANLTKSRVQRIRNKAASNPNSSWIVSTLDRLLQLEPETEMYDSSDPRNKHSQPSPTYAFITRYEVGKQGRFVTFCPQITDAPLRVIDNKSKFGFPRIQYLVIDPAPLTPFGLSRVRLASPNQNLMNAYYQNVASMFILNSDPPLLKRGRFTKPVQLKRRAVWETLDQNATVELKEMSNSTLQQFPEIARQMASQVQNMMGKPIRNTDLGNTSPGAKQQIKYEDTSTNQITNIMENFLRQYALVALDTYIAEQTVEEENPDAPNEDTLIIDDEAKEALNRLVPGMVGDDNKLVLNWNQFYDDIQDLSVEIELSVGKDELEEKTRQDLQDMLTVMAQTADPNDVEKQQKIRELEDRLLSKSVPESKRLGAVPTVPSPPPSPAQPINQTDAGNQTTINQ